MRRKKVIRTEVIVAAWALVGGTFLWSVTALADGLQPAPRRAAVAIPDYPELLGGEEIGPVVIAHNNKAARPRVEPDCITFEKAQDFLTKIDFKNIEDVDAFIRNMQRDLGDDEWCSGVRETIKIVLTEGPENPPTPEDPDPPGDPDDPTDPTDPPYFPPTQPPGGGGGPGYLN